MRKISAKIGVTALSLIITFGSLAGTAAAAQGGPPPGPPPGGGGDEVTVDCGLGQSLQEALDDASVGSTISVTGTCDTGPFFVRKDRTRLFGFGVGGATLSGPAGGSRLLGVEGDNVELRDLHVLADGFTFGVITSGTKILLRDIKIENAGSAGFRLGTGGSAVIRDSNFSGNGIGIGVLDTSAADIASSTVENNSNIGIFVVGNSKVVVASNTISDNTIGLFLNNLSSAILLDNTIEMNTDEGVFVGNRYADLAFVNPPNTIQGNGTDVRCESRAIVSAPQIQTSSTGTISINGTCVVFGPIF